MEGEFVFDFEKDLVAPEGENAQVVPDLPVGEIGQQPRNFVRNFRKTVCAFWVKGMCMKGDSCGFLHKWDLDKMPPCHTMMKKGTCPDPDCPFKHTMDDIKECNMYALGFCVFGPECRYKHTRLKGPPPDPRTVEAAKPKQFRDINRVVNLVNENVTGNDGPALKRPRLLQAPQAKPPLLLGAPGLAGPPPGGPRPPPTAPPPLPGSQPSAPGVGPPSGPPPNGPMPPPMRPPGGPRPPSVPPPGMSGGGILPPPFAPPGPRPPFMPPPGPMPPSVALPSPFHGAPGHRPLLPSPLIAGMGGPLPPPFRPNFSGPMPYG